MWKKILYLLEKNGVNRYQLSKGTGISYGNIQDWKSGKCQPSQKALQKIADFFSVPMEYFFDDPKSAYVKYVSNNVINTYGEDNIGINVLVNSPVQNEDKKEQEDDESAKLLFLYRHMTTEGQERLLEQADFLAQRYKK